MKKDVKEKEVVKETVKDVKNAIKDGISVYSPVMLAWILSLDAD